MKFGNLMTTWEFKGLFDSSRFAECVILSNILVSAIARKSKENSI